MGPLWIQKARQVLDPPYKKHDLAVALFSLLLLLAIPVTIVAIQSRNVLKSKADIGNPGIVSLINQYRAQNGLGPLYEDQRLANAACWLANDMAERNYLSHTDYLNRDPYERMSDYGGYVVGAEYGGENLAATNDESSQSVFDVWRNSPDHNEGMLDVNYTRIGLGKAYRAAEGGFKWYWVTNFASNLGDSYQPLTSNCVSNQTPQPPTVDIKANGFDGSVSINFNANATITWSSANADSCSVSPHGWAGTNGSQSTGNLTTQKIYTITCTGEGGTASKSVTVNINATSSSLGASPNPCLIPKGQTSCATTISWNTSGYNGVILCKNLVGTTSFVIQGVVGSSTQTLSLNQTYIFTLRSSPTNSCSDGILLRTVYANVYVFDVTGGDVNCDGVVNGIDSLEALRYAAGLPPTSSSCAGGSINLTAADFVSDGVVDALDALYILKKIAGFLTTSPLRFTSSHIDSDGDYLEDTKESAHSCMNRVFKDANSDPDRDSLTGTIKLNMNNSLEIAFGTNPCKADTDGDGFRDSLESYVGTDGVVKCALTNAANDESDDKHPLDFNDDKKFNTLDLSGFSTRLNSAKGDSKYSARYDLNADGKINTLDLAPLSSRLNTDCS